MAKIYGCDNKKQLRVAADWVTILFNYNDLFDNSTNDLTKDKNVFAKALKIIAICVQQYQQLSANIKHTHGWSFS